MIAWRIVKAKHQATALSGQGASLTGGRWNHKGTPLVYSSASLSLAALETFVHLRPPINLSYIAICIEFDQKMIETLSPLELPKNWRKQPAPSSTKKLGTAWTTYKRAAILKVPSVIIPEESNFLINPLHPDSKKIKITKAEKFTFDARLWQ